MRFEIDHTTVYRYSGPVFLEPFAIRLRPKTDVNQRLLEHTMVIDPEPSGQTEVNDLDGNVTALLWFSDLHNQLTIHTHSVVDTFLENPFNFLITDSECQTIPLSYSGSMRPFLSPYCQPSASTTNAVREFSEEVMAKASFETVPFLTTLCQEVHRRVTPVLRYEGAPYSPEESLARGEGACRDLAVLFMEVCRYVGLASRFVSGYHEVSEDHPGENLHAWAEVYLPGAGWRGYDPTNGFAVADRHVVVATGVTPSQAAPTSGTFRGTGVNTQMAFELKITTSTVE